MPGSTGQYLCSLTVCVLALSLVVTGLIGAYLPGYALLTPATFRWCTAILVLAGGMAILFGIFRDFLSRDWDLFRNHETAAEPSEGHWGPGRVNFLIRSCTKLFGEYRANREPVDLAAFGAAKAAANKEIFRSLVAYQLPLFLLPLLVFTERLFNYVHSEDLNSEKFFREAWIGWGVIAGVAVLELSWEFRWRLSIVRWVQSTIEAALLHHLAEELPPISTVETDSLKLAPEPLFSESEVKMEQSPSAPSLQEMASKKLPSPPTEEKPIQEIDL